VQFDTSSPLAVQFRNLISAFDFPCVGAKSALGKGQLNTLIARDLRSNWDDKRIYEGISEVVKRYRTEKTLFQSFAVIFERPANLTEGEFERYLWKRAESLTNKDIWLGRSPDHRVSMNPDDSHFSLSFEEEAFFVVGMHPNASRPARRFVCPVLVFNLHDQFEQLREMGRYEKMREIIIKRDTAVAGEPNPMLARHGDASEARQYSGRAVNDDWECPFHPVERA
jgi:FPC/CPF motif-containing protein YcgG